MPFLSQIVSIPPLKVHKDIIAIQTQYNLISTSETQRLIMKQHWLHYEQGQKLGGFWSINLNLSRQHRSYHNLKIQQEITADPGKKKQKKLIFIKIIFYFVKLRITSLYTSQCVAWSPRNCGFMGAEKAFDHAEWDLTFFCFEEISF